MRHGAEWDSASPDTMWGVAELDDTPLGVLSQRARYNLVRSGAIASVRIGARVYVTKRAIVAFLSERECRGACPTELETT